LPEDVRQRNEFDRAALVRDGRDGSVDGRLSNNRRDPETDEKNRVVTEIIDLEFRTIKGDSSTASAGMSISITENLDSSTPIVIPFVPPHHLASEMCFNNADRTKLLRDISHDIIFDEGRVVHDRSCINERTSDSDTR